MIISQQHELEAFCARISGEPFITVDTEFLRETTYWPQLCLLQVATPHEAVAIDPIAGDLDLTPIFQIFKNPNIVKVFHAGRQDLEIFWHQAHIIPSPIFDSQIAAMVLGYGEQVSYELLCLQVAKVKIDKSQRYTDWSLRPLSTKQLEYALADVTHLCTIYQKLSEELEKRNRTAWVEEELKVLTNPETYDMPVDKLWEKVKGNRPRNEYDLAVLQTVAAWRDHHAREMNVPRRRILKDELIQEIVKVAPRDAQDLDMIRGLSRGFGNSELGQNLLETLQMVYEIPKTDLPPMEMPKSLPYGAQATLDLLRVLLKKCSEENDVAAKIIATTDDLEEIIRSDAADVPAMQGWRYELFGQFALQLKKGEMALKVEKGKVVLMQLT